MHAPPMNMQRCTERRRSGEGGRGSARKSARSLARRVRRSLLATLPALFLRPPPPPWPVPGATPLPPTTPPPTPSPSGLCLFQPRLTARGVVLALVQQIDPQTHPRRSATFPPPPSHPSLQCLKLMVPALRIVPLLPADCEYRGPAHALPQRARPMCLLLLLRFN